MVENLIQKRRAQLQGAIGELGELVMAALNQSVACLQTHDASLIAQIIDGDARINQQRRVLEQECLVTLAAYNPAGEDLRAVGACMELVSELERIGDYAADVARILRKSGDPCFPPDIVEAILAVAGDAIEMLGDTLTAFTANGDEKAAREAIAGEDRVDRNEAVITERLIEMMRADPGFTRSGTYLLWIVHNYERVADRATNVAERAVYVASGYTPDLD